MKILHLYDNLMNLYGDYANAEAVRRLCEENGEEAAIDRRSVGDDIDLSAYDFVFVGSGTERNQRVALEDIRRLSGALSEYIESGKVALFTGNSFEMLGKSITDSDGVVYEGLSLFDFETVEQNKTRITSDVIATANFLPRPLVGFINKCGDITGIPQPLFDITYGIGNSSTDTGEGIRHNNLFCTHITGPLLIKNPHMLTYITSLILGREVKSESLVYNERGYALSYEELSKVAEQLS